MTRVTKRRNGDGKLAVGLASIRAQCSWDVLRVSGLVGGVQASAPHGDGPCRLLGKATTETK